MSRRAVHIIDAVGAAYAEARLDRNGHVLCGKKLWYPHPDHHGAKARETTIPINNWRAFPSRPRSSPDPRRCSECFRLACMEPIDRNAAIAIRNEKKRLALLKLQTKTNEKKRAQLAEKMIHIEAMRVDAIVCRDAWLAEPRVVVRRCSHHVMMSPDTKIRCALESRHTGPCEATDGSGHADLRDVLGAAVELYKLEHKSGGDKLFVLTAGTRTCNYCHQEHNSYSEATCVNCTGTLPEIGRASKRHVCCRFCRAILGRNQLPFGKYDHAVFDASGAIVDDFRGGDKPGYVDVYEHTVNCAFEYLLGKQETNQDDAPIVVPGHLPSQSFVLEMDP